MRFYILLFCCIGVVGLNSCKKSDNSMTDVASNGEYFNCQINGTYWTYKQNSGFSHHDALGASRADFLFPKPQFEISGDNVVDDPQTGIPFYINGSDLLAGNTIDLSYYGGGGYITIRNPFPLDTSSQNVYESDENHIGKIIFTTKNDKYIEGSFYFDAFNNIDKKTIHVTNGKFRINYWYESTPTRSYSYNHFCNIGLLNQGPTGLSLSAARFKSAINWRSPTGKRCNQPSQGIFFHILYSFKSAMQDLNAAICAGLCPVIAGRKLIVLWAGWRINHVDRKPPSIVDLSLLLKT